MRKLGLPSYTIVRPVFFMDNFLSLWFKPGVDRGKLMIGIKTDTVLQMIAVTDIAKYVPWTFEKHQELNGREIAIAGDTCTMPKAAEIIGDASSKTVEFVQVPIEEVCKLSEDFAIMLEWFDHVGYNADIDGCSKESGIRPITLREWAAKVEWS